MTNTTNTPLDTDSAARIQNATNTLQKVLVIKANIAALQSKINAKKAALAPATAATTGVK